jgi:hypothetical protein
VADDTLAKQAAREHRHVLRKGLPEKSKIAGHIYEEVYMIGFGDERFLEIERISRYKKYKEMAYAVGVRIKISQLSL